MPLTDARSLVAAAAAAGRAVLGFNVSGAEMVRGVVEAAERSGRPALVQFNRAGLAQIGGVGLAAAVTKEAASGIDAAVGLHLDHADSLDELRRALDAGFNSLMIDGSTHGLEEHIALVREAKGLLAWGGFPLEAELGHVAGTEDGVTIAEGSWTDPEQAERFVAACEPDWLAVAVGNVHGGPPLDGGLQHDRLAAVHSAAPLPLVLHGASGLPAEELTRVVGAGVAKINVGTGTHRAFADGLKAGLAERHDARYALRAAQEAVREFAEEMLQAPYAAAGA